MEIAKRYSIAYKGLADGKHEFSFDVGRALFEAFDCEEVRGGECRATVAMEKSHSALTLDGRIAGQVVVECDRCLEDCALPVEYEGRLVVKFSDEIEEYDGEVMWIPAAESEISLAQYIYESILLSLPYRRVHPDGECDPAMMVRFAVATAEEFDRMEEEAERRQAHGVSGDDMAKLAALKARMESDAE
ncbi:MAG: DUF177 domain-containing protein [Alistipes sp.]|nr:DUF177 domain-containing protein [Alistipes sp.]